MALALKLMVKVLPAPPASVPMVVQAAPSETCTSLPESRMPPTRPTAWLAMERVSLARRPVTVRLPPSRSALSLSAKVTSASITCPPALTVFSAKVTLAARPVSVGETLGGTTAPSAPSFWMKTSIWLEPFEGRNNRPGPGSTSGPPR